MVDGIEERTKDVATVVRVDILSADGARIADRYGVVFTPGFVVFDRSGAVVERPSRADPALADRLRALAGTRVAP